jgi:hypothetical protein
MPIATTSPRSSVRRRLTQVAVVGALGTAALSSPAFADLASCMALCQMQDAYCEARSGVLVGSCNYDYGNGSCTLPGCQVG